MQELLDAGYTHFMFNVKMATWWGKNSVYTSALRDAKPYTEKEAIAFSKLHKEPGGGLGSVPVRIEDLVKVA